MFSEHTAALVFCVLKGTFMKSPLVKILIVLNLLFLGIYLLNHSHKKTENNSLQSASALYEKTNKSDPIPKDDFVKLADVSGRLDKNNSLSDDDLRFVLQQMSKRYEGKISGTNTLFMALMLKKLRPTEEQKPILLQGLKPILAAKDTIPTAKDKNPATKNTNLLFEPQIKAIACLTLGGNGVKEAIPYILPLLDDPSPKVRQAAKRSLNDIQGKKN